MSLKIITFANHKGGVSKTTSTASIGACMARMGKKVLLIDLDGQANLTLYFIPNEDEVQASIFDSLVDGAPLPVKHIRENLDLVPSSLEMASAEIALTNLLAREQLLSRLLEPVKQNYDYILIDCMPSLGMMTINALAAADSLIVPLQPSYLSTKGLDILFKSVSRIRKTINPTLRIDGILLTMVDSRTINARSIISSLKATIGQNIRVFDTEIPHSVRAVECALSGGSIYAYDKQGKVAHAYERFTKEVEEIEKRTKDRLRNDGVR